MYIPLLSSREPSNRERRIASMEAIVAFLATIWLVLEMPHGLAASVAAFAPILLLLGHGGAILARSNPMQVALWPEFARRMGSGKPGALLDERDQNLRHRAFLISYQILALVILAAVLGFDLLLPRIAGSAPHKWTRLHDLMLVILALLVPLTQLLPGCVLPWLEKDASEEDDTLRLSGQNPLDKQSGEAPLFPKWIRIIGSDWVVWTVVVLLMLWAFSRFMPGSSGPS